ncbi:MAG: endonuclease VIII [Symbiobacteriaceae bacterium]|nr:endonuclease VIII [Symbiobacteriaceae bacterium]
MIELPEASVLADQSRQTLVGKTIHSAVANSSPHGFAWYTGDPALYSDLLQGKTITAAQGFGGRLDLSIEELTFSFNDGVNLRYLAAGAKLPPKHQLLIQFTDGDYLVGTVQMYGGLSLFPAGSNESMYYLVAIEKPSPFSDDFDAAYFDTLWQSVKPNLSVKAFLATEQRIPGLGNGVLQDILFNAGIHPKRKLQSIDEAGKEALYNSVRKTLVAMRDQGGRDTEKDLWGQEGGYQSILSRKTLAFPCRVCGSNLKREAYLGGNIYFCPTCQPQ